MATTAFRWSEPEICKRLSGPFPSPAHLILKQVRNGTGFARGQDRTADALIVSTWPSRGLWIAGVEVKTYLGDWKRELANADKSASIQQFCKYWYIAAPEGLIPRNELPETWGLIECTQKKATVAVKAPDLSPKPPDMLFVCSLFRSFSESFVSRDEVRVEAESLAKTLAAAAEEKHANLLHDVEKFKASSGIDLRAEPWWNERLGEAVKLVQDTDLLNGQKRLTQLRQDAAAIVAGCEKLLNGTGRRPEAV